MRLPSGRRPAGARPSRRVLLVGLAVVALVVVGVVLLTTGGGGSPEERRDAIAASERLTSSVTARPTPTSRRLCAAVGPRTRGELAALARYLPAPRTECRNLPNRLLRAALEPLPGVAGRPLEAEVDGDVATVSLVDGPEVSRATRTADGWRADPGVGGLGAWRLETARRCSRALTTSRMAPLTPDPTGYRRAVTVRLRGVVDVLDMLQGDRLPGALDGRVSEPRNGLTELRDGLRRALQASESGDAALARNAPDSAQLPSVLQLLEAFASLRELGAPCLGGPSSPGAVDAGNAVCAAYRQSVDTGYRVIGRSETSAVAADGFRTLAGAWRQISRRIGAIDLSATRSLQPVQTDAVRSGALVAVLADRLATQTTEGGGPSDATAADLDLAQQSALDALMALGFRECGAIS
ncbi:hypothetical protein [Patulibacter sp.]|uniref:hypothetical protein n=1 Tax=Patulibacter sp. TaxID=1912859 RepID=UPI002727FD6B|nr:hypothetical protein [Patulibacter sp.]MDO9408667.1 hypothetical protein [Patulibacter sp.]